MQALEAYRLRLRRKRFLLRAMRKGGELACVSDNLRRIVPRDVLLFATLRNEHPRLPHFLRYYRRLGVGHFLLIDNGSDDGGAEYLAAQSDVTLWQTARSYRRSRYGVDWLNFLRRRHGHGRWCLTVDVDEFLVYPFCDTRPLRALTDWLDASSIRSFGTLLLDLYPKDGIGRCRPGEDPVAAAPWFDTGNYQISRNTLYGNLWVQGGPRARAYFEDAPHLSPALNKIPLVKWHRRYAYASSTHMLLPRGLNRVYDEWGGEKTSGVLLHAKFVDSFEGRAAEEAARGEHYAGGREYRAYEASPAPGLWTDWSERYLNWRQLEMLGLMSTGNWA